MSSPSEESFPPRVLRVVRFWSVAAVAGLGAAAVSWPPGTRPPSWTVFMLATLAVFILTSVTVNVAIGETLQVSSVDDAAVAAAVLLLPPGWALVAVLGGQMLNEALFERREGIKIVFNLSWATLGVLGGAALIDALQLQSLTGGRWVLGAILVASSYPVVNAIALGTIVAAHDDSSTVVGIGHELTGSMPTGLAVAGIGVVAAAVVDVAPELLPLLALPAYLGHTRSARVRAAQDATLEERDKLVRTIEGASDGIALLQPDGTVEVCNDALAQFAGLEPKDLLGERLHRHLALVDDSGEAIDVRVHTDRLFQARIDRDQDVRVVAVRSTTVAEADGENGGRVLVLRDVTKEREIDTLREDLVSRVSHELRTPLTTITGFTETLLARYDAMDDEQRRTYLETVLRGSRRLSRLVTALRARAGLQGSTAVPHPDVIDLRQLVDESLHDLSHELGEGFRITTRGTGSAWADRHHVRQVLDNLLVNAATYGSAPVCVVVNALDGYVELRVIDHGAGVPEDFVPHLFQAFSQASTGDQRTARGLGLGLSIVRALVETNGGRISYEQTAGGGATFAVTLPSPARTLDGPLGSSNDRVGGSV